MNLIWYVEGKGKFGKYRRYGPFSSEAQAVAMGVMQKLKDTSIRPKEVKA